MRKSILGIALVSVLLAGCSTIQTLQGAYKFATETTVSPGSALIVANAFDALKGTAVNYARYCVAQNFPAPVCSASNRRAVIKAVNAGTAARTQVEGALATSQPVLATVYNILVTAVNTLQSSPISTVKPSAQ